MLPGQQRRLVTPGKNEKFYIAGGLDVLTGKLIKTGLAKKNSELFIAFLGVLDRHYHYCGIVAYGARVKRR